MVGNFESIPKGNNFSRTYRQVIKCKNCGKKIEVKNSNRELCEKCGYRGKYFRS